MLKFLTAGVPISSKKTDTISGLKRILELNLDGMELEFVRGVKMKEDKAKEVYEFSKKHNLFLSVHAPYYINLATDEKEKLKNSYKFIIDSAIIGYLAGAKNIVFHPGYYQSQEPKIVHKKIKERIKEISNILKEKKIDVILRPETMGKPSQYGSIDEVLDLMEIENVKPCIDIAHLHARENGKYNNYKELVELFKKFPSELINDIHIHYSGIIYDLKGEKKHVNLWEKESDMNYYDFIKVLIEFDVKGLIVSESPYMEIDALLLKEIYEEMKFQKKFEIYGFSEDNKIHKESHKKVLRRIPRSALSLFDKEFICKGCFKEEEYII
ncbi:MAG: TIM barrel protein [candidate division WOR-3 bacterium]|jgi:deoxyribonuclease-4